MWSISKTDKKILNRVSRKLVTLCSEMDSVYEGLLLRDDSRLEDNYRGLLKKIKASLKSIKSTLTDSVVSERETKKVLAFVKKISSYLSLDGWSGDITPLVLEMSNYIYHSKLEEKA